MRGVTLVKTWLALKLAEGKSKADALRELNQRLGTTLQHSHLSRWERGERTPAPEVRTEMMRVVVPHILREHGKGIERDIKDALEKLK